MTLAAACLLPLVALSAAPVKLGAPGLSSLNLDDRTTAYYSDFLANRLSEQDGVSVVKSSEIGQLLGLEKQKQLLGCSEKSCAMEIAQALGVDAILSGSIGKFGGDTYQVDARLVSTLDGSLLASDSARVEGDTALLEQLTRSAEKLAEQVKRAQAQRRQLASGGSDPKATGATDASATPAVGGARRLAWIPMGAGLVVLGVGGYYTYQAAQQDDRLRHANTPADASAAVQAGKSNQLTAQILVVTGILMIGSGAAVYAFGGDESHASVAFVPTQGGGAVAVSGSFR